MTPPKVRNLPEQVSSRCTTAVLMAAMRAYHCSQPGPKIFSDPLAESLLSASEHASFIRLSARWLRYVNPEAAAACSDDQEIVRQSLLVGAAAGPLIRARFMEESLLAAVERQPCQYVIIGAGLDTFGLRHPVLPNLVRIIEIDHPEVQASKRTRLADAGLIPPQHAFFVPANLEHESVTEVLARTPHDRDLPTFFTWPGVTMYLSQESIWNTLRAVAGSAPGSEIAFDYVEPGAFTKDASVRTRYALQRSRQLSEPIISSLDPATLPDSLRQLGLRLVEDLDPAAIESRYLVNMEGFRAVEYCHLARAAVV